MKSQELYWLSQLRGSKPTRLPADHERASYSQHEAGTLTITCGKELKEKLWAFCQQEHVTWFMLLISVFRDVHFQWTGKSDASLGSPIANRHKAGVEQILGFFVNTQVFRVRTSQGQPFTDLVHKTRELALNAFEHQDIPFDRLAQILKPPRDAFQNPLVEMVVAFQTVNTSPYTLPGLDVSWYDFEPNMVRFDLESHWSEAENQLRCVFFYRKAVFEHSTMARLAEDIMDFLHRLVENPDVELNSEKAELAQRDDEVFDPAARPALDHGTTHEADGPPQDGIEERICLAFHEVLGVSPVTQESNFFEHGGHSLFGDSRLLTA